MALAVGPIAQAVAEIAKTVGIWIGSSERLKLKAAVEAGEKYIQTNEDTKLSPERKAKLLLHYRKRFFASN